MGGQNKPPARAGEKRNWAGSLNQLPKWLSQLNVSKGHQERGKAFYEPEWLHIHVQQSDRPDALECGSLDYLLEQLPALRHVHWTGDGDPLGLNDWLPMVSTFHEKGIQSTMESPAYCLEDNMGALLRSPIESISLRLNGTKPSNYAAYTRRPAQEFLELRDRLHRLVTERLYYLKDHPERKLKIELVCEIDVLSFRLMPEFIRMAEEIGVDQLQFRSYMDSEVKENSRRCLSSNHKDVASLVSLLKSVRYRIPVLWPSLIKAKGSASRQCQSPHTTVHLKLDYQVGACPFWRFSHQDKKYLWEGDFWNGPEFQTLRQVHQPNSKLEVPMACQRCTHNT